MTERECQTCRYFDRRIFNPTEDCTGWCLRYPPVYVGPRVDTLTPEGPFCEPNQTQYWEYHTVGVCSCCGEWREREEVMEVQTCPFCGGEAKVMHMDVGNDADWTVWAVWCVDDLNAEHSHGHFIDNYGSRNEAVAAWNRMARE